MSFGMKKNQSFISYCFRKLIDFSNKHIFVLLFVFFSIILIGCIVFWFEDPSTWLPFNLFFEKVNLNTVNSAYNEVEGWLYFITGVGTTALAVIAYHELKPISDKVKAELITDLYKDWDSENILEAQKYIYIITKKYPEIWEKVYHFNKELNILKNSNNQGKIDKYFTIICLLNYLERIAVLWKKKQIDINDLHEIFDSIIIFYYKIFETYINDERMRHPKVYEPLIKLYEELNKNRTC